MGINKQQWLQASAMASIAICAINLYLFIGFLLSSVTTNIFIITQLVAAIFFGIIAIGVLSIGLWRECIPALPATALLFILALLEFYTNVSCKHPILMVVIWYTWVIAGIFVLWTFLTTRNPYGWLAKIAAVAFFLWGLLRASSEFWVIYRLDLSYSLIWNGAAIILFPIIAYYFRKLSIDAPTN